MGIDIPSPPDTHPPSGYSCPALGMDDMPNISVTISGVISEWPDLAGNANGSWILKPQGQCSWIYPGPGETGNQVGIFMWFDEVGWHIDAIWGLFNSYASSGLSGSNNISGIYHDGGHSANLLHGVR